MTPKEVVDKVLGLNGVFQLRLNNNTLKDFLKKLEYPTSEPKEDFSQVGYNSDKEEESTKEPSETIQIIIDKESLQTFNNWLICTKIPTEVKQRLRGYALHIGIDVKTRQLTVSGADYPFSPEIFYYSINCEHIKDIKIHPDNHAVLVIFSDAGQTAFTIPTLPNAL